MKCRKENINRNHVSEPETLGLNDLLNLFEENISVSDITSSEILGKVSASIVKKRTELRMTQKEFANYVEVSQGMVSKWEGGDYNFSIKTLAEIAEKLDMELNIYMGSYKREIELKYKNKHTGKVMEGKTMLQFANGFSCAMDREKGELIISFVQQVPEFGDDGEAIGVKIEEVSKLVMGKVVAQNLLDGLTEIMANDANKRV